MRATLFLCNHGAWLVNSIPTLILVIGLQERRSSEGCELDRRVQNILGKAASELGDQ